MERILVTGGAGFIGSNFVRYVLATEEQVNVINLDLLTYAGSKENLSQLPDPERHTFIEGDIADTELVAQLLRDHRIDTIVNFAAETHVDRSIADPSPFIQTNVMGTFALLEAVRPVWLEERLLPKDAVRFHHISTDEVFGSLGPDDPAFTEASAYSPNSPYAASKGAGDHLVRSYAHTYELPITITNCSNNYGPHQFPEKLVPLTILNALEGKPIPIYGAGENVRDWLFVDDHCRAVHRVLKQGTLGSTYNIGGGNQPTNLELVQLVCSVLDELVPGSPHAPHESLITFVEDRPGHDLRYAMDASRLNSELGWEPEETLESGIRKTVEWYLANQHWTDAIARQPSYKEWYELNYSDRGNTR